jgi:hypothetical protein
MPASLNTSSSKTTKKIPILPTLHSSSTSDFPSNSTGTAESARANQRQVYILPPPSSFTGYHLVPPLAQNNHPSIASPIYYETKKQRKSHYGGIKRTAEESSTSKKPRIHYKRNNNDPISAAATTLASFARARVDKHDGNLSKQEVQILEVIR